MSDDKPILCENAGKNSIGDDYCLLYEEPMDFVCRNCFINNLLIKLSKSLEENAELKSQILLHESHIEEMNKLIQEINDNSQHNFR